MYSWEFPRIRGTLIGGPYNKDPTIWGTILGPLFSETPSSMNSNVLFVKTGHCSTSKHENYWWDCILYPVEA